MGEIIKVGMADLKVCAYPDSLTTLGLGSCVGIALYDKVTKITGLAHIMLPDSKKITRNENIAKFADTGIEETVRLMLLKGANKKRIVAKIAGGADMFNLGSSGKGSIRVGESNVLAVRENLARLGIPIVAEDVGLNYGRTVIIRSEDGGFVIKSVGKSVKEI
jgi:chemotaxis protein CheD